MPGRDVPRVAMGARTGIPTRGPLPLPHWRPLRRAGRGPQHVAQTVRGPERELTETQLYGATARLVGPVTVQHPPRHAVAAGVVGPVRVGGGMGDTFSESAGGRLVVINGQTVLQLYGGPTR